MTGWRVDFMPLTVFLPVHSGMLLYMLGGKFRTIGSCSKELSLRSHYFARLANLPPIDTSILAQESERNEINAFLTHDQILVTETAAQKLTLEELDFFIAHEIAHLQRLATLRKPSILLWILGGGGVVLMSLLKLDAPIIVRIGSGFLVLVATICPAQVRERFPTPRKELWCDCRAVELTQNPAAAISALEKMHENLRPIQATLGGYPSKEERIRAIRAMNLG
jgi:Zn-dependent protease with chaperone function